MHLIIAAAFLVATAMTSASGCAGRRSRSSSSVAPQSTPATGLGERTLPSGSSLARARRGLLPEEDGILSDIHFQLDSYDLDPQARSILNKNAEWLKDKRDAGLEIEGHADERGTIEYNLALGARRAKAGKDYMVVLGVSGKRIETISYGEELPVCSEHNADCWRRNRRAHFVVVSP